MLYTSANVSALGQNATSASYSNVLQRVAGAIFNPKYGRKCPDYFYLRGQYDIAVSGGVEIVVLTATLGSVESFIFIPYGANTFDNHLLSHPRASANIYCLFGVPSLYIA